MSPPPLPTKAALKLWHEGAAALAAVSAAGQRIDVAYLDRTIQEVGSEIKAIEADLKRSEEYKLQRKKFGEKTELGSRAQLGWVLFTGQGHKPLAATKTGRPQLDETALEKIGTPYCKLFLRREKLSKLSGTYLKAVKRELIDDLLRCNFNLHLVTTYRGSADSINYQNIPIRDKEIAPYIRRAFIPRAGHILVECDLKANEVRLACCYSKDPRLIRDTLEGDMHRDMAAECFMLPKADVPKDLRQHAKSNFVFAEFFGSYYVDVARSLWDESSAMKTTDGTLIHDHLRDQGITGRGDCIRAERGGRSEPRKGTFEAHIKKVEERFWGERYSVYDRWRRDWWKQYQQRGWFQMLTGFVVTGVYKRNEVLNSPIQGSAFHCLLWSLVQVQRWLARGGMRTVIVGQIHDSLILDVAEDELEDVLAKLRSVFVEEIRQAWPWLLMPLGVEIEGSVVNWWEKRPIEEIAVAK